MCWVPASQVYFAGYSCGFEGSRDFFLQINSHEFPTRCISRPLRTLSTHAVFEEFSDMFGRLSPFVLNVLK